MIAIETDWKSRDHRQENDASDEAEQVRYFPFPRYVVEPLIEVLQSRIEIVHFDLDLDRAKITRALAILSKLPECSVSAEIYLTLTLEYGQPTAGAELSNEFVGFEIAGGELSLTSGGYLVSPDVGGDSFSRVVFQCDLDGHWTGDLDSFENWNETLAHAALGCLSLSV